MRVRRFRVERYRSIEKSESIDLSTMSVLVGPNNEGKSNLLRGLVVGLLALGLARPTRAGRPTRATTRQYADRFERYDWKRDFPLNLQMKTPGASSVFEFEFEFNEADIAALKAEFRHTLNGELKLRVLLDGKGKVQYKIIKKGPGSNSLNENAANIAAFISRRIRVEYIPISRTSHECRDLVVTEARAAVAPLLDDPGFIEHVQALQSKIDASLVDLESQILHGVQEFLPDTSSVTLSSSLTPSDLLPHNLDILIDDGQRTDLSMKGDGVQSLIAMSLVARLAANTTKATFILAVEEPESHLHPGAIRKLRLILEQLAIENQVILTTHSPVLVRRDKPTANILVESNQARRVNALREIRSSLGVEIPDNLSSADVVLVVEGKHDVTIVRRLLADDQALGAALKSGRLAIQHAGGASQVPYHCRLHHDGVASVHVLLDDDKAGRAARTKVEDLLHPRDITMTMVNGMGEAEIEDLFDEEAFGTILMSEFNVKLDPSVSHPARRFSIRMEEYFRASGQKWNDSVEANLKTSISALLASPSSPAPIDARLGVVEALHRGLTTKLGV